MNNISKKQSAEALQKTTILLIEDSGIASTLICDTLEAQGYNVEAVNSVNEALDWLQTIEPDLLLLDYRLPDFNGDILIGRLAEQGRKIPFIIITGHGDEKIAVEMMKLGAIDYLVKDEAFIALLPAVVKQTLRSLYNQRLLLATEVELQITEQNFLESQRQLETLLTNIPGMAYRCRNDRAWTMEFVSEGCRDLLGCSPEELIGGEGVNYGDLIHPEDRSMVWGRVREAVEEQRTFTIEYRIRARDGQKRWVWEQGRGVSGPDGTLEALEGLVTDISERKKAEAILKGRIEVLTQPDAGVEGLSFENLFDLDEIQAIQDAFSEASGVPSIITDPEGRYITKPSNFCRLCRDIIRKTEKGLANCMHSDTVLGRVNPEGPNVQPCMSGGLWDGGASICVGDRHIATWLVGQVRNEELDEEGMLTYAREIGADEEEFRAALAEVQIMSTGQFKQICESLFVMANQLSSMAYRNVQQARAIHERDSAQVALRKSEEYATLLADISGRFVALPARETDWVIDRALKQLGETVNVARSYVITSQEDFSVFSQTHEWCAPGVVSLQLQRSAVDVMPWALTQLLNFEILNISDVARLPDEACRERWQRQGIHALLGIPIRAAGKLIGMLGLDYQAGARDWDESEVRLVQTVAEIFGNAIDSQSSDRLLRESKERLDLALKSSNEGVWDWDMESGELFLNPGYFTMLGYEPGEFPATIAAFEQMLHPEDREAVMAQVRTQALAAVSGERYEMEFRLRTKTGGHAYILSRGKGVAFDAKGCPNRLVGTHVDISARHHHEKQVVKVAEGVSAATGENFFRSLVKHLSEVLGAGLVGVAETLPKSRERMRVIAINDGGVEMGGFEYELAGTVCELLLRGGELTVADGVKGRFSRCVVFDDRPSEGFVGAPLVASGGEVIGTLFAFFEQPLENPKTDASMLRIFAVRAAAELERERREEELRRERSRYQELYQQFQTILEGIPEQISLLSPDLEILWSNRQGTLLAKGDDPLIGRRHCFEYSAEKIPFCDDCHAARTFANGEEQDALLRNGQKVFGVKFFPLCDEQGKVHSVIALSSDITEKKHLQEEAERASRLASLGEIAAGVAHEINNPNALILLNTAVLGDVMAAVRPMLEERFRLEGDFPLGKLPYSRMAEELPRLCQEVVDSSGKIRTIVEDLRGFDTSGGLAATELDLNGVAERALRMVRRVNPEAVINFRQENRLPAIRGNAQQLEQVLINLLQNGIEALPGKSATVSLATGYSEESSTIFVEVRDEGNGIPEDTLAKITDPFFTTKREAGGTGLGLSISARIIKEHQGTLQFFSRPNGGTRVRVELPVAVRSDND